MIYYVVIVNDISYKIGFYYERIYVIVREQEWF